MLDNLKSVNWASLHHAYGNASDVPKIIRSLLSSSKDERSIARRELGERINHQGSCYQATPFAVPFLIELIQNRDVLDRHSLILNLVCIAVGLDSDQLPYGFNLREFRGVFETRSAKLTAKQRAERSSGPHINLACYESVNAQANVFVSLLTDDCEDVRIASAFALCWFPECVGTLDLSRTTLLQPAKCTTKELTNVALSYGLLSHHLGVSVEADLLNPMLDHRLLYVRVAAAIAMAKSAASTRVVEVLVEGAKSSELSNIYETTPFNEGDLQHYARKVLDAIPPD